MALSFASVALAEKPLRPFPQHIVYTAGSIFPSQTTPAQRDAAAVQFYDAWKARYVHAGCVPGQLYIASNLEKGLEIRHGIAVSEGQGYGMVITALMAGHDPQAQVEFDQLYAFFRAHPSRFTPDLMAWVQVTGCTTPKGQDDSATDGDMDIAYALLLAHAQWGSADAIDYRAEAHKVIAAIKKGDLNAKTPSIKLGDWVDADSKNLHDTRLSDFMTNHFRAFQRATGDPLWSRLIDRCYAVVDLLQADAPDTGLVPDFARQLDTDHPVAARGKFLESKFDGEYSYNSCRFPWRIAVDYLLSGEPRAKVAVEKINTFFKEKTGGDPRAIRDGYRRADGKIFHPDDISLAFVAPLAVSAMVDAKNQAWLDQLWTGINATPITDQTAGYYGNTLKLLSLLVVSGNWWTP